MTPDDKAFFLNLLNTPSPSGFEAEGQKLWLRRLSGIADEVGHDAYGNGWAILHGQRPDFKVMLEAHADEIGFMVQNVTEDGFIYVLRTGGSDRAIARGKRVHLFGDRGPVLGVVGNTAVHLRDSDNEKAPQVHELFIDVGARSRAEVLERGVRVGCPLVYCDGVEEMPSGRLIGRAIDNRVGGFILSRVLAELRAKEGRSPATVVAVNSVQEELGGHGIRMTTPWLLPDLAIVLDVSHATDSPGIDKNRHGAVRLGAGPTLTHGTANHPEVVRWLVKAAETAGVPVQHEASSRTTGTDTDQVFVIGNGIPSALVSIPLRYMHSTVEMIDLADVERCVALLVAFVGSLTSSAPFRPDLLA